MSSGRQQTHPSRRINQSVSSTASARSDRGSRTTTSTASPAVESAVTRLLVSIKQLLESLTLWSRREMTELQVSDVYVRLGNDFNAAVAAFTSFNIDMSELLTVPDELRGVLETCLSEDATPENLDLFLPEVRKIITNLLQGLRGKQSIYRRIVADYRHKSSDTAAGDRESRSSRSDRTSRRDPTSGPRQQSARSIIEPSESLRRSAASSSSRRKDPALSSSPPVPNGTDGFVGGFVPPSSTNGAGEPPPPYRSSTPARAQTNLPPEVNGQTPSRARSASSIDPSLNREPANGVIYPPVPEPPAAPTPRPPSQVPSHVKRYSLVDRPVTSPTPPPMVVVDEAPAVDAPSPTDVLPSPHPSPPQSPPPDSDASQTPAVQASLAALKKNDALERRASKRFSTYNISKMTGGSIRERLGSSSNPNRRSLAGSSALTPGDLAVLTEADEDEPSPRKRERSKSAQRSRNPSPIEEADEAPPVPPLPLRDPPPPAVPAPVGKPPEVLQKSLQTPVSTPSSAASSADSGSRSFPVFLQVGREVKRVILEPGSSFSSLRVLFVDRFAYNPGKDNFPAIYIRDPSSGVQYELEDMDEVKDKCLLSLNIEPLDQIKQHIDAQISNLSQDIKDLRTMVASNRRASVPPMIMTQALAESTPPRPTDRQFRNVARRLSRLLPDDPGTPTPRVIEPMEPQTTGMTVQPQMTGASVVSEYTTRVVTDLKTQFDEVQNLRRDLGIMRQLYTEFMKQTKESLGALRTQTQNVRQLATAKVGGTRAYIDDGKTKLDSRSQNVLTKMEELQDLVEGIKDDVLKRNVSPKPQVLKNVKADMDAVAAELQSLKEHIQTVKPMWKKTWEEELQNIVEEQQFLQHQEEFLSDLLEDEKAVMEVYGHVEKVISLRGQTRRTRNQAFKPPPMEDGHTGLGTVLLEIRGAAVDAERRMKAIAANEKNREKELAGRSDEFQSELNGFVEGKKLKMTGGAAEAERVRQRRNEQTLKAMFTGSSPNSAASSALGSPLPEEWQALS